MSKKQRTKSEALSKGTLKRWPINESNVGKFIGNKTVFGLIIVGALVGILATISILYPTKTLDYRQNLYLPYSESQKPIVYLSLAVVLILSGCALYISEIFNRFQVVVEYVDKHKGIALSVILIIYFVFWHRLFTAHFCRDDYMHLAAAGERIKTIADWGKAFFRLDVVDRNFRPLSTDIYLSACRMLFGYREWVYHFTRSTAIAISMLFLLKIAKEIKISTAAGLLAIFFYLTRSCLFTIHFWISSMPDVLAILSMAASFYCYLKWSANSKQYAYLVGSFLAYVAALASKQTALMFPVVIFLAHFFVLDYGNKEANRWLKASIATFPFGLLAIVFFIWGIYLRQGTVPYEISLQPLDMVVKLLSYIFWIWIGYQFPHWELGNKIIIPAFGAGVVLGLIFLYRYIPFSISERRYIKFFIGASFAFLLQVLMLPGRFQQYYLAPALFWFSLAMGLAIEVLLLQCAAPAIRRRFIVALLIVVSIISISEIQLKAADLIMPGGYPDGYSYQRFSIVRKTIEHNLSKINTPVRTVVLVNFPYRWAWWSGLIRVHFPSVQEILFMRYTPPGRGILFRGEKQIEWPDFQKILLASPNTLIFLGYINDREIPILNFRASSPPKSKD